MAENARACEALAGLDLAPYLADARVPPPPAEDSRAVAAVLTDFFDRQETT